MLRHRISQAIVALLIAAMAGLTGLIVFWAATGGRWMTVETPSMGAAAPVGTLLWVRPVAFSSIRVGEIISFRSPADSSQTFSHRVIAIDPGGTLATKGDINSSADPWKVSRADVIGKVAMRWWGMGWALKAAPFLILGGLALGPATRYGTSVKWRLPARIVGASLVASVAIYVTKPLVRAQMVTFAPAPGGGRAILVGTGLLPLRASTSGGGHVNMVAGHLVSLVANTKNGHGLYAIHVAARVSAWWWLALVLVCLTPAIASALFGSPTQHQTAPSSAA